MSVMSAKRTPSRWSPAPKALGGRGVLPGLAALLACGASLLAFAPAAQAITIEKMFSGNCKEATCGEGTKGEVVEPTKAEAEEKGFRQAGGFVPYGVTAFEFKQELLPESLSASTSVEKQPPAPEGFLKGESVRYLRTDVAPGVVTNPFATTQCSLAAFTGDEIVKENPEKLTPALYIYPENKVECPIGSIVGVNQVLTDVEPEPGSNKFLAVPIEGFVYNLEPLTGFAATYGVALYTGQETEIMHGVKRKVYTHTIIEGNVEWATNYHDYFEIHNIPPGLIRSRLAFFGDHLLTVAEEKTNTFGLGEVSYTVGTTPATRTTFLRNPTTCNPPGPATTTTINAVSDVGQHTTHSYTDLVGTDECEKESPFGAESLSFELMPNDVLSDQPNGVKTVLSAKHPTAESEKPDISDLKTASIVLPPGMTMNPAAAAGLEGCTPEQIGIGTRNAVTCPAGSKLGTVTLEVPTLPAGSLTGNIYLGKPASGPITGPPYTIYLDAESSRYGVKVRLKGTIVPNPETGQLVTTFEENPEAPFNSVILSFRTGPLAPLANPLTCGSAETKVTLTPYSGTPASFSPTVAPFTVSGCPGPTPPFAAPGLGQEATLLPANAGGPTTFTFKLARAEGQQYLSTVRTVLPPGLVGEIPKVNPCPEAQANAGTCSVESEIGTVSVQAGSGSSPYTFNGTVYLTEHYGNAPYGLSIVVPAVAGPFSLGNVITRAKVEVEPYTAQVVVSSQLPTIVAGIPIRLRSITFTVDRQGFYRTPTSCAAAPLQTLLGGTQTLPPSGSASATLESPVQATNCAALAFKPAFAAETNAKTSRTSGASLTVTIGQVEGEAAIKRSVTTLPIQLPSRLATLQKACPEAQGAANIFGCPATSLVGHVKAVTPTLPGVMQGPVYIVSQGGRAFPNLEPVLQGDGVTVILIGNTDIHNGITTTTFAANPDVPISSFTLELPEGPHSLLSANGSLCRRPLAMPTTLEGQNGKQLVQRTKIKVSGCLQVVRKLRRRRFLILGVRVPAGGRLVVTGGGLKRAARKVRRPGLATVRVALTPGLLSALRHHKTRVLHVKVHFAPKLRGGAAFTAFAVIKLR